MSDIETFSEWLKKRQTDRHDKNRPVPVKDTHIDSFLSIVDNLKRDLEELDSVEKRQSSKLKLKKKPEDKPKDKADKVKKKPLPDDIVKKKGDVGDEDFDEFDVLDDALSDRFGEPVRLPSDGKVPDITQRFRRKPDRTPDPRSRRLGRD
jgi:hypothetical protein